MKFHEITPDILDDSVALHDGDELCKLDSANLKLLGQFAKTPHKIAKVGLHYLESDGIESVVRASVIAGIRIGFNLANDHAAAQNIEDLVGLNEIEMEKIQAEIKGERA